MGGVFDSKTFPVGKQLIGL